MIDTLKVKKLNGEFDYEFKFNGDLNLFTGQIGTGKTTLLKLIWFLTSGNLHRVIFEIPFDFVSIKTTKFGLSMEHVNPNQVKLIYSFTEQGDNSESLIDIKSKASGFVGLEQQVDKCNKSIARVMKSSLFFPTFRRMERNVEKDLSNIFLEKQFGDPLGHPLSTLQSALSALADALSVDDHKFVISASTYDVIDLLKKKKIEIDNAKNAVDDESKHLVEQWELLNQLVNDIYTYYDGIYVTDDIVLGPDMGKTGNYIPSGNLSSGEKQLLSFLCYNAFFKTERIFIDEPELSLHPDWQRLLIDVLEYQGTEKQFFIASHSPYISMKYERKEFPLRRVENE